MDYPCTNCPLKEQSRKKCLTAPNTCKKFIEYQTECDTRKTQSSLDRHFDSGFNTNYYSKTRRRPPCY